jgi:uncharacterized membrane protein HdeD (DUF308 family)
LIDLALAVLIIVGFPGSAAWAVGLIVGIDLIFGGTSLIIVALTARMSDPQSPGRAGQTTGAAFSR